MKARFLLQMLYYRLIWGSKLETELTPCKNMVVFVIKWLYTYIKSDTHHKMEVQP